MSQYVDTIDMCQNRVKENEGITLINVVSKEVEQYILNYALLSYESDFEGEPIIFYAIKTCIYDIINGDYEGDIVYNITSCGEFAETIFKKLHENDVTPTTMKHCIYDILVERYG